jgi:HlyD family secretion protein
MRKFLLLSLIPLFALAWWLYQARSSSLEVPFTRVKRETLVSILSTNGKVEPLEWVAVRTERTGVVAKVHVQRGQNVKRGALLVQLDARNAKADLAAAEARITQARAELEVIERGGRSQELAEIESGMARARLDLQIAHRDLKPLERLADKQAATSLEVSKARDRVRRAELEIKSLERKRASLVSQTDRTMAQARLQEAAATADLARGRIEQAMIRAPMAGAVYETEMRAGSYLNQGDLVANVGQIEKVRVRVYVDEPELGRVSKDVPVSITWDALPGRQWSGSVERMPTEIVALGTRQVGEVICTVENLNGDLLPGTNVNAEIRSQAVENALIIPREALRRQSDQSGVFVLDGDKLAWREVKLGAASITLSQVLEGLSEGDSVALPTEYTLRDGDTVKPVYP